MTEQEIDWDGIKEGGLPPEGIYSLFIDEVIHKNDDGSVLMSAKENVMWKLKMMIKEGDYQGYSMNDYIVFTPKALWKLKSLYSALGADTTGKGNVDPQAPIGMTVLAECEHEEYENREGKKRLKLRVARFVKDERQQAATTIPAAQTVAAPITNMAPTPAPKPAVAAAASAPNQTSFAEPNADISHEF